MDLHGTLGTKFLTAKAGDAFLGIDNRNAFFHHDCFCRTDLLAFSASDAGALFRNGLGTKSGSDEHGGKFSAALKLQTSAYVDVLIIGDRKAFQISMDLELVNVVGDQARLSSDLQRGNVMDPKTYDVCAGEVKRVRGRGGKKCTDLSRLSLRRTVSLHPHYCVCNADAHFGG